MAVAEAGADDTGTSEPAPSKEAELRQSMLEHLVEYWYSQDETLRLADQWTRYEDASARARAAANQVFADQSISFRDALDAATAAVDAVGGLTSDQHDYAIASAIREHRPVLHDQDGYAGSALKRVRQRRKDMGLLSAQLVTLVADFELFVLRATSAWLSYNSNHLAGKERTLTFRELSSFESIDEIREPMVQSFLEEHMRKSATGWFDEFSKLFGGVTIEGARDFGTLEVFQRRHIIVHHGGMVSRQYLDALSSFELSVKLGDDLPVDIGYVRRAATSLACVAHSIAMCALMASTAKSESERKEAESEAGELTYILLTLGRNRVADSFISKYDLDRMKNQWAREQLRVNGWIAKRRLGQLAEHRAAIEAWDTDAADDRFKLAKLVLLEKRDEAIRLAVEMVDQRRLSPYSVAMWPLFENLRDEIFAKLDGDRDGDGESLGGGGEPELGSRTAIEESFNDPTVEPQQET